MKLLAYLKNPNDLLVSLLRRCKRFVSDKAFIRMEYRLKIGEWPNLKNPQTLAEKIQWIKLYDREPRYVQMVDKIEAKKYVASIIGEQHIIPTLGMWEKANDIDLDALPGEFVLKCNHRGGGMVFICKDKATFNFKRAKRKLKHQLKKDMYLDNKEWAYRDINRRIFAEKYMVDESGYELKDYKFYCFNGVPRFCQVISNRYENEPTCKDVYDMDWNLMEFSGPFDVDDKPSNSEVILPRPEALDKMIEIATKLSETLPFVRVDLYHINGEVYFGELTFYPASGMRVFKPMRWNKIIGDMLVLPS